MTNNNENTDSLLTLSGQIAKSQPSMAAPAVVEVSSPVLDLQDICKHVAAKLKIQWHLHPKTSLSSPAPALPSKADRFQCHFFPDNIKKVRESPEAVSAKKGALYHPSSPSPVLCPGGGAASSHFQNPQAAPTSSSTPG